MTDNDAHWKSEIEARVRVVETNQAENRVRYEAIQSDIHSVRSDIKEIKGQGSWITRLVIGAIIAAFLTFVFQGGLAGG